MKDGAFFMPSIRFWIAEQQIVIGVPILVVVQAMRIYSKVHCANCLILSQCNTSRYYSNSRAFAYKSQMKALTDVFNYWDLFYYY